MGNLFGVFGTYENTIFVHKCALSGKADVLSEYIPDKYYLRKFLRSLCLISRNDNHRKMYRTSLIGIRREDYSQLRNHYYFIHPFSPFRYFWECVMIIMYITVLVSVPLFMVRKVENSAIIMLIYQFVTTANIIVQFFSGYFDESTNRIIFVPKQIFKNYFWQFILDLLASLPISFILQTTNANKTYCNLANYLFIFNSYSLYIYSTLILKKSESNLTISRLVQWACAYLLLVLWFSSTISIAIQLEDNSSQESIDYYLWMSNVLSVMFGLKKTFATFFGTLMVEHMFLIIIGFIMRNIIVVHIILLFKGLYLSSRKYHTLLLELNEFAHKKKLSLAIKKRIFSYYEFKYKHKFFKEKEVWNFLPDHYKYEIEKHWSRIWFESDLFKSCSIPVMHLILQHLVNDIYLTNDIIYLHGSIVNNIYFLKTGTVAFYDDVGYEAFHLDEGNFFSDAALILAEDLDHKHTAIAVEPCEVYKLGRQDFRDIITLFPQDYQMIMEKLNSRTQRARKFSLNQQDVADYLVGKNK